MTPRQRVAAPLFVAAVMLSVLAVIMLDMTLVWMALALAVVGNVLAWWPDPKIEDGEDDQ